MPTARKIVLPGTFTDNTLPFLRDDPILANGSLALYEPAHPGNVLASGVPADATDIPNIAFNEANSLVAGTAAEWAANFRRGSVVSGSPGIIERSSKGGIHLASSLASSSASLGFTVLAKEKLLNYLITHPTNDIFVSTWGRLTRPYNASNFAAGWSPSAMSFVSGTGSSTTDLLYAIYNGGSISFPSSNLGQRNSISTAWSSAAGATPQAVIKNIGVFGSTTINMTAAEAITNNRGKIFGWGSPSSHMTGQYGATFAPSSGANPYVNPGAFLFYRAYIEDLTVSGRSYAAVDALDYAEYTKQVTTAGGRYYADTYTDPATIA